MVKKLSDQVDRIESEYKGKLSVNQHLRRATIKKEFIQQQALFHQGEKPSDWIVSIDRPYLRPIVRGKEVKSVECGAKVNTFQIGGISFIEHLSFDAFHEGNRFLDTIFAGADAIYATN